MADGLVMEDMDKMGQWVVMEEMAELDYPEQMATEVMEAQVVLEDKEHIHCYRELEDLVVSEEQVLLVVMAVTVEKAVEVFMVNLEDVEVMVVLEDQEYLENLEMEVEAEMEVEVEMVQVLMLMEEMGAAVVMVVQGILEEMVEAEVLGE